MSQEKVEKIDMVNTYIKANVAPILIEGVTPKTSNNAVVIPANCDNELLNGHYEGMEFVPPKWYNEIMSKKDMASNLLIIDNITSISLEEQLKFCEILKHRKVSTFELPSNCTITITCDKIDKDKISPEIYSLVAHIKM